MKVVGVTGPIGSGKSTVATRLTEKGALVLDADIMAREVVEPGEPAWKEIVAHFGGEILEPDQRINRRKLGRMVFSNETERAFLNSVVHPRVIARVETELGKIESEFGDGKVVVLDVPLLIEVGLHAQCDITVVVTADKGVRLERLIRNGLSREEAETRIASQKGKESMEQQADIVITNNGTPEELNDKAEDLWKQIISTS